MGGNPIAGRLLAEHLHWRQPEALQQVVPAGGERLHISWWGALTPVLNHLGPETQIPLRVRSILRRGRRQNRRAPKTVEGKPRTLLISLEVALHVAGTPLASCRPHGNTTLQPFLQQLDRLLGPTQLLQAFAGDVKAIKTVGCSRNQLLGMVQRCIELMACEVGVGHHQAQTNSTGIAWRPTSPMCVARANQRRLVQRRATRNGPRRQ